MAFDGLFTRAMVHELAGTLTGGRISKIHQPSNHEILLVVRANGTNHRLLLSAHPSYARAQLTNESFTNPNEAPMFCMLLRKHLEGFVIERIHQPDLERIIEIRVNGRNEIGDLTHKTLIIEIMGKHSNILLVDSERGMILDCIKHVSPAMNSYRSLLPGQAYLAPPAQEKQNLLDLSEAEVSGIDFTDKPSIVRQFAGVSPFFAKQLSDVSSCLNFIKKMKAHDYCPSMMQLDGKSAFYLWAFGEAKSFATLSELLDRFYFGKAERDRVKQQANDLERLVQNELDKNHKKIAKLEATLADAKNADVFKKYGELLTANLYALENGMARALVMDYYAEQQPIIEIALDLRKTPNENAQAYFTKYQKAKKSIAVVKEQIALAETEIAYFENVLYQLQVASPSDVQAIREELETGKYLRVRGGRKKKTANGKPQLESYSASDGTRILVGKNNLQNEYLTMRLAARNHIWLHTKDIPGSHVVIQDEAPSDETLMEAATIAAYFSQARASSQVPVDYTAIRHVRKPSGAKPGFVTYDHQKTLYVTPNEDLILQLKKGVKP